MNSNVVVDIHSRVRHLFEWVSDRENYGKPEHWTSHADGVERGESIQDDCDGFAMTCAELAFRSGVSKDQIRLATCYTENNEFHAVAIVSGLVMDNRYSKPMAWNALPYRWDRSMRLSEPGVWRSM